MKSGDSRRSGFESGRGRGRGRLLRRAERRPPRASRIHVLVDFQALTAEEIGNMQIRSGFGARSGSFRTQGMV